MKGRASRSSCRGSRDRHRLDEVARARIAARLAHGLDVRAVARARRGAGGARIATTAIRWLLPAAAAALAAWFAVARDLGRRADRRPSPPAPGASTAWKSPPAGRVRAAWAAPTDGGRSRRDGRDARRDIRPDDALSSGILVGDYDGRSRRTAPRRDASVGRHNRRDAVRSGSDDRARPRLGRARPGGGSRCRNTRGWTGEFVNAGQTWEVGREPRNDPTPRLSPACSRPTPRLRPASRPRAALAGNRRVSTPRAPLHPRRAAGRRRWQRWKPRRNRASRPRPRGRRRPSPPGQTCPEARRVGLRQGDRLRLGLLRRRRHPDGRRRRFARGALPPRRGGDVRARRLRRAPLAGRDSRALPAGFRSGERTVRACP